jgi:hypothetical protein
MGVHLLYFTCKVEQKTRYVFIASDPGSEAQIISLIPPNITFRNPATHFSLANSQGHSIYDAVAKHGYRIISNDPGIYNPTVHYM